MESPGRYALRDMRSKAHKLKPVVLVGKDGLTKSVFAAVDAALAQHELIKVKLLKSVDVDKDEAATALAKQSGSWLVQRIGRMAILFRPRPEETT